MCVEVLGRTEINEHEGLCSLGKSLRGETRMVEVVLVEAEQVKTRSEEEKMRVEG